MSIQKIQISIPKPCSEDWSKMTPTERGRFCSMCTKEVVDFTQMSDAQLVKFLEFENNSICLKAQITQLNRAIYKPHDNSSKELDLSSFRLSIWDKILATSLFVLSYGAIHAKTPKAISKDSGQYSSAATPSQYLSHLNEHQTEISGLKEVTVSGIVLDSVSNKPIPFARIYCTKYARGAISGLDGKFELKFNFKEIPKSLVLQVSCVGQIPKEISILKADFGSTTYIYLTENENIIEIVAKPIVYDNHEVIGVIMRIEEEAITFPVEKKFRFWRRLKFWTKRERSRNRTTL